MIHPKTLKLIIFSIKWGYQCGGLPYDWNSKTNKLVLGGNYLNWTFSVIYYYVYSIFVFVRTIRLYQNTIDSPDFSYIVFSKCLIMVMGCAIFSTLYAACVFKKEACLLWVNFYIREVNRLRSKLNVERNIFINNNKITAIQ